MGKPEEPAESSTPPILPTISVPPPHSGGEEKSGKPGTPYAFDLLVAIVSAGFPFGWSMIFPPNVIVGCICWALTLAAILDFFRRWSYNAGKFKKTRLPIILFSPILILAFVWKPIENQYRIQHSPAPAPLTDTNVLAAVKGVGSSVGELTTFLSTNQTDPRLAVLTAKKEATIREGSQLQKSHEIIDAETVDLKSLRTDRDYRIALYSNQTQQAEIQKRIDDIQAEQERKQNEEKSRIQNDQERSQSNKDQSSQILPVFDYTIGTLNKMLGSVAKEAGEKRYSDIEGSNPAIYASDLVSNGIIVDGKNFISIGTNSAWRFEISTVITQGGRRALHPVPRVIPQDFASLNIICHTTNGNSTLNITPIRPPLGNQGQIRSIASILFDHISINLNVPNVPDGLVALNFNAQPPYANYTNEISQAIQHLIEAQDKQSPLITKP
jgi:hypothetical protein